MIKALKTLSRKEKSKMLEFVFFVILVVFVVVVAYDNQSIFYNFYEFISLNFNSAVDYANLRLFLIFTKFGLPYEY
jgi:hypothetical protein